MANDNIAPPLDTDLGAVDTSMPLLKAPELYKFRVNKSEIKATSSGGEMASFEFRTIMPGRSMKDEDLGAGIAVFDNMMVAPSGKATWDMVIRNIAGFIQSIEDKSGLNLKLEAFKDQVRAGIFNGRTFTAKVGYEPAGISTSGRAFREKNVIAQYIKAS